MRPLLEPRLVNDVFGDPLPGVPKAAYLATRPADHRSAAGVTERVDGAADENLGTIAQDGVILWTDADVADTML